MYRSEKGPSKLNRIQLNPVLIRKPDAYILNIIAKKRFRGGFIEEKSDFDGIDSQFNVTP